MGASGFLGTYLSAWGLKNGHVILGTSHANSEPSLTPLDISNSEAVTRLIATFKPELVFLPAAIPNVDLCETDPVSTGKVNIDGARIVAGACKNTNCRLVYFSSDYVFDGEHGPYIESDMVNPICEYGRQKLQAETYVQEILPNNHLILRTTVVFGWEKRGKNFVERLLVNLRGGKCVKVPRDQIGNPTYVEDLADAAWNMALGGNQGIFHIAGSTLTSRAEFARKVAEKFGLPTELVQPVDTVELKQKAPRPLNAGMKCGKAEIALGRRMCSLTESLDRLSKAEVI